MISKDNTIILFATYKTNIFLLKKIMKKISLPKKWTNYLPSKSQWFNVFCFHFQKIWFLQILNLSNLLTSDRNTRNQTWKFTNIYGTNCRVVIFLHYYWEKQHIFMWSQKQLPDDINQASHSGLLSEKKNAISRKNW